MRSIAKRRLRCLDDYGDSSRGNDEEKRRGGAVISERRFYKDRCISEGKLQFAGMKGKKKLLRQTSRGLTVRLGRKPRRSGSVTNGIVIVKKLEGQ